MDRASWWSGWCTQLSRNWTQRLVWNFGFYIGHLLHLHGRWAFGAPTSCPKFRHSLMNKQLYRLFLIYGRSYVVLILPALAYLAASGRPWILFPCFTPLSYRSNLLGLAILQVVLSGLPNGNFFGGNAAKVATAFYSITVCLNIVLTALICGRLLQASKHVSISLGKESAKVYTGAVAILVESSTLYSVFGIMYLVPFAMGVPIADLFGQLWTKTSVCCSRVFLSISRLIHFVSKRSSRRC